MASLLLSIVSLISFVALSTQQNDPGKVTCYSFTGQQFDNNTICPGSHVCCNTESLCDPNRFCQANNQTIVPACAVFPWSDCANICQYDPGTGFLPRAIQCDDGSYCCDNDPQCCADNIGIVLNGLGAIVSTDGGLAALSSSTRSSTLTSSIPSVTPTSTLSSTLTTISVSSNQTPTSTSPSSTTASSNVSKSSSTSAGVIAGIVILALALVAGLGAFVFWLGRRRGKKEHEGRAPTQAIAPSLEQQREKHLSRHMLGGTPVYESLSKSSAGYRMAADVYAGPPQELSAGTPYMR